MNVFNKESLRSFLTQIAFKNFVTDIDYTEKIDQFILVKKLIKKQAQLVLWLRKGLSLVFFGGSLGVLWRLLADSWLILG